MRTKTILAAVLAAASFGGAATAGAATLKLDLDPGNTGPYNQIDAGAYFVPRTSNSSLLGNVLDDFGAEGNSCIRTLTKPLAATDWEQDGGIWCPNAWGDGGGRWGWSANPPENEQYKAVTVPDDNNGAAESNVVTLFTGPELYWNVGFKGNRPALQILVTSSSEEFDATVDVFQGKRKVYSSHVSGNDTSERYVYIAKKRSCAHCLKSKAPFMFTVTPTDRTRWVTMTASGRVVRGRIGYGGPVL